MYTCFLSLTLLPHTSQSPCTLSVTQKVSNPTWWHLYQLHFLTQNVKEQMGKQNHQFEISYSSHILIVAIQYHNTGITCSILGCALHNLSISSSNNVNFHYVIWFFRINWNMWTNKHTSKKFLQLMQSKHYCNYENNYYMYMPKLNAYLYY